MFSFKFAPLLSLLLIIGCNGATPDEAVSISPQKTPPKTNVMSLLNIPYDPSGIDARKLDLYLPHAKRNEPLLIFIHGGAWIGGDKSMYSTLAESFANEGVAVALVNYRLSTDPHVQNPKPVEDAALAFKYLVSESHEYGYLPTKIFVSGHSAGAHIAGMMATGQFLQDVGISASKAPAGFIGLEGIYDVPLLDKTFPSYQDWFLTKAFGGKENWVKGSPTLRPVVLKSPWLVVQSTEDRLVDVAQASGFVNHLKQAGVQVELWEKPDGDHGAVVQSLINPDNAVRLKILSFIGK
jgi:acetyl esterase/lipase